MGTIHLNQGAQKYQCMANVHQHQTPSNVAYKIDGVWICWGGVFARYPQLLDAGDTILVDLFCNPNRDLQT